MKKFTFDRFYAIVLVLSAGIVFNSMAYCQMERDTINTNTSSQSLVFNSDVKFTAENNDFNTETISDKIKVYPTFSKGVFMAEFPAREGMISVIDLMGRTVSTTNVSNTLETVTIDMPGVYIIRMECLGVVKTVKVVNMQKY